MQNLKHNRQLQYHEERSITHNTDGFYRESIKIKTPLSPIMYYIMDHETISYKAPIQEFLVQWLTVSHCHTKIGKFLRQFTASRQPASTAQSKLIAIPE